MMTMIIKISPYAGQVESTNVKVRLNKRGPSCANIWGHGNT